MKDIDVEEMLREIDAMTNEEYWQLYHEAQEKVSDFPQIILRSEEENA
jgi:hypothetical protein